MNTYEIKGYLNNYGFCVKKNKLNEQILTVLKNFFSVKPELNYENEKIKDEDKYFTVYYSDDNYIVLPKFSKNITINLSKYVKTNNKEDKKTIQIDGTEYSKIAFKIIKYKYKNQISKFNFNGKLRDYQQVIIDEIFKKFGLNPSKPSDHEISQTYPKGGIIKLSCGGGKCLGYNTPVMMHDGTIKMVQDVVVGDKLMGDDSKSRKVQSLARGRETMYKIIQENGDDYIVNSSHILSLYKPDTNEIVDIGVQDYLNLKDMENTGLYGFKVQTKFNEKKVSINPYLFGLILQNPNFFDDFFDENNETYKCFKLNLNLTNSNDIYNYLKNINLNLDFSNNENDIYDYLKTNDLITNPKIPLEFKANISDIQLNVLAGIIDSIALIYEPNAYVLDLENKQLVNDICFILNSLNYKYFLNNKNNIYSIVIYDNDVIYIPTKIRVIYCKDEIKNIKQNYKTQRINYYPIKVEQLDEDDYYGFEIDGNRRFLLGDFTVTHNTMLAIYLSWALGLKTLVITHKEFLMDQWEERIAQFTNAKVGRIRQNVIDTKDKDIVIGMLRSLSIKDYPKEVLQEFGTVILDEVHHTGSRVDSQALLKTSAEYTIGLSATPERADGMTKLINWHVGDILYEMEKKYNYRVLVKKVFFRSSDPLFKEKKTWFQGRMAPNHVAMTENITKIKNRNLLIFKMIDVLKGMGRKILVLSYRVEHLELLKKMVDQKIKLDEETHIYNSYFYMGKTKRGEKKLAEKDGHIIFATMQLAEEGLDISHLDTVIFALPVSIQKDKKNKKKIKSSKALIQSIGRILRNDKLEDLTQIPLVIDLSDMFSIYSTWSNKRNEIYGKKNWYIQNYYWDDLEFLNASSLSDDKKKPMNIMFDDITDEDFIEKNLILSDEDAKNISIQDKQDEIDELNEIYENSTNSNSSKLSKNSKNTKNILDLEEDIQEIKPISYGFGKKNNLK